MFTSKIFTVINIVAFVLLIAVIAFQVMELTAYGGF